METGIYSITCRSNSKVYIGYALNFKRRWKSHKVSLKANKHYNTHLQAAYNLYGKENAFKYERVEICEVSELCRREHYWAMLLCVHNSDIGFNQRPTDPNGKPGMSEESKRKIGDTLRGRKIDPEATRKSVESRKILYQERGYIWTPEGKESMRVKLLGVNSHPEGFDKRNSERMKGNKYRQGLPTSEIAKQRSKEKTMKGVEIYNSSGEYITEFLSVKEASIYIGVKSCTVTASLQGVTKQTNGYQVKIKGSDKKILSNISYKISVGEKIECTDTIDGLVTIYNTTKEASEKLKLTIKQITHNIYGASKIAAGKYKFKRIPNYTNN